MVNKHFYPLLACFGLFLAVGSILMITILDFPLTKAQPVIISSGNGDQLVGRYVRGQQPMGVLLLEGFGSDQVTMTNLASQFVRAGLHVFTFDFSGHGRSQGSLGFDNAQTDRLALETRSALQQFQQISGLQSGQIFMLGHSLGARVALQTAILNPKQAAGLILLGTQVNLSTNVQSEFFTGTTDIDLPWVQSLGPQSPAIPILLVSGAWDDILTPAAAEQLFDQLTSSKYTKEAGVFRSLPEDPVREQWILGSLVHNYEPFSERVVNTIQKWLVDNFGANFPDRSFSSLRVLVWILALVGLLISMAAGDKWLKEFQVIPVSQHTLSISNLRRFLWGKLSLWLAALPVAAILGSLFFVLPVGKPVFNLIYVGFIGGYGLLLILLYRLGRMPGVSGRIPRLDLRQIHFFSLVEKIRKDWRRLFAVLGITVGMLLLTAAYARTGWFYVFPINIRLAWLFIFTPFTALGFWIGLQEAQMAPATGHSRLALNLIGLFPFFLYTILMAAIGSLSGMIGGLQGLVILWLVLAFGNLVQTIGRRSWVTALCMSIMLYWLILPQGVLFG